MTMQQSVSQSKPYGIEVLDNWEFMTKFVMEPNLGEYGFEPTKFNHINKTWIATNLTGSEAKTLRKLSENIQLLNTFNVEIEQTVYTVQYGEDQEELGSFPAGSDEEAQEMLATYAKQMDIDTEKVVLEKKRVKFTNNRFDRIRNIFLDNLESIPASSAGKQAAIMQLLRSFIQKQEQTVEDKTESRMGGFFGRGKKK